jgi:hypothetical protein
MFSPTALPFSRIFNNHVAGNKDGNPVLLRAERDDGRKVLQNPMTKPDEYLAMGIEFYLKNDETRTQLKEKDPDLFRCVERYVGTTQLWAVYFSKKSDFSTIFFDT